VNADADGDSFDRIDDDDASTIEREKAKMNANAAVLNASVFITLSTDFTSNKEVFDDAGAARR